MRTSTVKVTRHSYVNPGILIDDVYTDVKQVLISDGGFVVLKWDDGTAMAYPRDQIVFVKEEPNDA